jgi:ABC-2 type transport system permease protein
MPAWTLALGNWLWFKYTISFPVQMVLGKLTQAEILEGITFQCGWIAVFAILGSFMFRRGLRIYSAVGM